MKNKILICLCFLAYSHLTIGQNADLTVDGEANLQGNVGIGTSLSSNHELFIEDTNGDNSVLVEFLGTGRRCILGINPSSDMFLGTTTDHDFVFVTNDQARMILTPEGNFGIGTPGPTSRLHLREDGDVVNTNTTVLVLESEVSKKPTLLFSEGGTALSSGMSFSYDGSGSGANNKINILNTISTDVFTFTSGGNLGVGESSPTEALTIDGDLGMEPNRSLFFYDGTTIAAAALFDTQDLRFDQFGAGKSIYLNTTRDVILDAGDDILLDAADDVVFRTAGNVVMLMDQTGNLGIGANNSPNSKLHLTDQGTDSVHALRLENDSNSNDWDMDVGTSSLILYYNSTVKGFFSTNGAYTITSDRNLKKNIHALEAGSLDKLAKLKAKSYYFKNDEIRDEKSIGFIAQEVLEVLPSIVKKPESENGFYAVDYGQFSVYTIQAIQEQQELIGKLKLEIEKKLQLKEQVESNLALAHKLQAVLSAQKEETAIEETKK